MPPKPDTDISVEPFLLDSNKNYQFNPEAKYPVFFHTIGPDIRSQIGGPDGFFFGDLKLKSRSELVIQRGLSLTSVISMVYMTTWMILSLPLIVFCRM